MPAVYTEAQKKAWKLLRSPARHIMLFGGSRSGKTFLLVAAILVRAIKYTGSRHAIIRYRYNAVKQSVGMDTLPKVMSQIMPGVPVCHNRSEGFIRLPNGSEIWLVGLDDQSRVEKILGKEFATVYFNECSEIDYNACQIALTRLAQNVPGLINKAYYDCNPAGKSHWSYKLFIQKLHPVSRALLPNPDNYAAMRINPEDNRDNLPEGYIDDTLEGLSHRQKQRFQLGLWLDDTEGALWSQNMIDNARVVNAPELARVVIAVDPAVTDEEGSDQTGIIAAAQGMDGDYYVLADATLKASPLVWCREAVNLYWKYEADRIVGEANNGGDLIEALLRQVDSDVSYRKVWASRGKIIRAEPVAALYEKGRVHHVGVFPELEDEMTGFAPLTAKTSPNRMDALVWAVTELSKGRSFAVLA